MQDKIIIKGAREHNLKNINLEIPRDKMVIFTGLSGSGKSSLAFDTIFAEGQRRYIESLSAYARQFLGRLDKPDVDEIDGLSPAISIDQKSHSSNPRSTVATITEIYDYLRVLFARAGKPHCPICGLEIKKMTNEEIVDVATEVYKENVSRKNMVVLAPVVRGRKGEYYQMLYDFLGAGFSEVRVDGIFMSLRDRIELSRYKIHSIDLVVDRLPAGLDFGTKENRLRLAEAVETGLKYGHDVVTLITDKETSLSAKFTCPHDGFSFPEIEPRLFSFNSPYGACPACNGLGTETVWSEKICPVCLGKRLRPEALNVLINKKNIAATTAFSIAEAYDFFNKLELTGKNTFKEISEVPLREIKNRLKFMIDVGLDYLTLARKAGTLSGGEAQRIRLASQIGSRLTGTLYILDEPTIGLHQRDNAKLIRTLHDLRDLGNTVIVVEHDEETICSGDYLVDIGPAAGVHGGKIVAYGKMPEIIKDKNQNSLTLEYLRGKRFIEVPSRRRKVTKDHDFLKIKGAAENNLQNIDVNVPLRRFTAVTGVSGSGKSTLVYDVLYKTLANKFNGAAYKAGVHKTMTGLEYVNRVVNIDQSPIGRTPRSNPATYVGAWTFIRDLFASTEDARVRGYKPGRFSFNVKGGRCENCEGHGLIAIEMHFLPTVYVVCDICKGKRFDRETLAVEYKGKNIYDVLQMTVEEAVSFFEDIPWLHDRLRVLNEVGLGYLELGQSATTLSGGEAQRIKLTAELGKRDTRKTIYLLDEPTTGLHFADVDNLLNVLNRLVERGNTIVVIEHNLDVIKTADWVIDLGPEGGDKGGRIVAQGTPEDISKKNGSFTAEYLRKVLK
ncbi:MAG: Excinuclease ABC, subunit A [Candidatus Jorgensenbacteria bacterium GW2011_GWA1_48_11]|uniref:UvrABC system protein A n=1 Tax=Candidatus Jorgensenbacteria bacterium GW2011_GWA1_48_11 TaxID=1618660 RepID=A0A0G1XBX3_9BACT|nr:MAG: Excinuclease ABC, subunit A [Candidatus Jorgensenbacteria bacterium GW2011_GWA1_48_11]KKW12296.1 MAG: Excinuclease ABC, subunit A [Candidatus Jorgensenbacteria bacterium GW2011_GWB1_49_9]